MTWNRPRIETDGRRFKPNGGTSRFIVPRGGIAALIVVLCVIVVCILIKERPSPAPIQPKAKASPSVKKAETSVRKGNATSEEQPMLPTNVTDHALMLWHGKKVRSWTTTTNMGMVVQTIVTADGKTYRALREQEGISPYATDQILAMVVGNDHDGGAIPPIPGLGNTKQLEKEFRASLNTPIRINDNDSDAVKELKRRIADARQGMAEAMDAGQTFSEVIEEAKKVKHENYIIRAKALAEYNEILNSGDADAAESYLFKVNLALQQMGIKELPASGNDHEDILRKDKAK